MSLITKEIMELIEKLESGYHNAMGYAGEVMELENELSLLQKDLWGLTEFSRSNLYEQTNDTVRKLVDDNAKEISLQIIEADKNIKKYYRWVLEYLGEGE